MNYFNLPFTATGTFVLSICFVATLGYLDHRFKGDRQQVSVFYAFGWGAGFTISTMLYYLAVVSFMNPAV